MTPDQALRGLRAPDQRNMGRATDADHGEATAENLAAVEGLARTVRAWNPQIVPGLLQTLPYAAGAIKTAHPALPGEEIQRRALQRQERIRAFAKRWTEDQGTGYAWFVLGESAITEPVINPHSHAGQLEHLLDVAETFDKVVIQVLPDYVPTPGRTGQFSCYELQGGQRVGYLETLVGGWYTSRPEDIARMYAAFSDMLGVAMSPSDSRVYIKEELKWWKHNAHTTEPSSSSRRTPAPVTASASPRPAASRPSR